MRAVELTLLSYSFKYDEIGLEEKIVKEELIPIINTPKIMFEEFYAANEQGIRADNSFKISSLNYSGQTDLIYMGEQYSIIRTTSTNSDELILICERRIGNVKESSS